VPPVADELLFRFDISSSVPPENWRFGSECGAGSGRFEGCEREIPLPLPAPSPSLSLICFLPEAVVVELRSRRMGRIARGGGERACVCVDQR
jgi:hypothetical protein